MGIKSSTMVHFQLISKTPLKTMLDHKVHLNIILSKPSLYAQKDRNYFEQLRPQYVHLTGALVSWNISVTCE